LIILNIKKILIPVLITTLSISLLAGCKSNSSSKNVGGKTQIEYWHVATQSFGGPTVTNLVNKFNGESKDVTVTAKFNADMYKGLAQNLQAAAASKQYPAVVQMGYNYLNYAAENFKYVTPDEVIKKYFPEDKNYLSENFSSNILDLAKVNGKQIGIPYSISNPIVYYNADIFKAAGLDPENPPKTWDEVKKDSEIIKQKTGIYGFYMQEPADNWAQQALMEANGGKMTSKDNGTVKASFATKQSAEAYDLLAGMIKDNTALHVNFDEGNQAFLSGKVAMCLTTIGKRDNFEKSAKFDLRGTEFPLFGNNPRRVPAGGNFLMITAQDEAGQKAAWKFIKSLLTTQSQTTWTKGTGYLPSGKNTANDPKGLKDLMAQDKLMKTAEGQMKDIVPWTSFPGANGLQAEQVLIDTRDSILSGKESSDKALKDAQDKINNLIK
jgi:multiple sugar transport system substrate-binding protein